MAPDAARPARDFRVVAALAALSWLCWAAIGVGIVLGAPFQSWEVGIWIGWWAGASVRLEWRR